MADTKTQILLQALKLLQSQGYNATTIAQIAKRLKIKTSGVHYYFPYKEDLVTEVVANYRVVFSQKLEEIDVVCQSINEKIERYCSLYEMVMSPKEEQKICLCAVLAAEFPALPERVKSQVQGFFNDNQLWLAKILGSEDKADLLIASLEGSLLLARTQQGKTQFRKMSQQISSAIESYEIENFGA